MYLNLFSKISLKCSFTFFVLIISSFSLFAQNANTNTASITDSAYTFVDKMPEFPGGTKELAKFISRNLKITSDSTNTIFCSKVCIRFIVNEDGQISNIENMRDTECLQLFEAAKKTISLMPPWIPGELKGKKVKAYFMIPVNINLKRKH